MGGEVVESSHNILYITNPCFTPSLVDIEKPVGGLTDETYEMYTTHTWSHTEFTVAATDALKDLCGPLIYKVTAGEISADISYVDLSVDFTITLTSDNAVLIDKSEWTYMVEAYFEKHPNKAETDIGKLTIDNPCKAVSIVEPIAPYAHSADFDSHETINFPTVTVDDAQKDDCVKQITYSCLYVSGPLNTGGIDLCAYDTFTGTAFTFDHSTGVFTINVSVLDRQVFGHGDYVFTMTAHMMTQSVPATLTLTLNDPCKRGALTVENSPFDPIEHYKLKTNALVMNYDPYAITGVSPLANCGILVLEFSRVDSRAEDPFTYLYAQRAISVYGHDTALIGEYQLSYNIYYNDEPEKKAELQTPFTVMISDECEIG